MRRAIAALWLGALLGLTCGAVHAQRPVATLPAGNRAANSQAADANQPPGVAAALVQRLIRLPDGLELTPEQQAGLEQIRREEGPKLLALIKTAQRVDHPTAETGGRRCTQAGVGRWTQG